jgi:hypothetical protein
LSSNLSPLDQKTSPIISLETDEYLLLNSLQVHHADAAIPSLYVLKETLEKDQLQILRSQLIRKNRLLADLKRQLLNAQSVLTQLYCMTDPTVTVTVTLNIHKQETNTPISLLDCAVCAMEELDNSSNRMSYLVKQLKNDRLSTKF